MKLEIRHPHQITFAEALSRAKMLIDNKRKEYPSLVSKVDWKYFKQNGKVHCIEGKAVGNMFEGHLTIYEREVHLILDLAFILRPWASSLLQYAQRELSSVFDMTSYLDSNKENLPVNTRPIQLGKSPIKPPSKAMVKSPASMF